MWLVKRSDPVPGSQATELTAQDASALRRAYEGIGSQDQIDDAIELVKRARMFDLWIACDCLESEHVYPLMTPAYLTDYKRYYLRRLTTTSRPEHEDRCAFRFDRPEPGLDTIKSDDVTSPYAKKPKGLFSVLKKEEGEGIASSPNADTAMIDEQRRKAPALAPQLWRLMDDAGLNRLAPLEGSAPPSIAREYQKLKTASERIDVAKGVSLSNVTATFAADYHSKRLFARIRQAYSQSHDRHPLLQGFALLYTNRIKGQALEFDKGEPLMIAGDLSRPVVGDSDRRAPYLTLVVIGDHKMADEL